MQTASAIDISEIEPRLLSFLQRTSCDSQTLMPFHGNWGRRSYFRVQRAGKACILMQCQDELSGGTLKSFVDIGDWLKTQGLSVPEIYEREDLDDGVSFVLLEDFGDAFCNDYDLMSDCIIAMQKPRPMKGLRPFLESTVYQGHRRVVDWFVPCYLGQQNPEGLVEEYLMLWDQIASSLPQPDMAFIHMDFHPDNFIQLSGRGGVRDCGMLDFQDGCVGPTAYDYTNLLKDIRNDVPQEVIDRVLVKVTDGMSTEQKESFDLWYKLLCVQFHFRIAGQVLKLSLVNGRDDLMVYLPRVMRYLEEELQDPMFSDLSTFFKKNKVEWSCENLKISMDFIAEDAF